jgi:hypothetical protein
MIPIVPALVAMASGFLLGMPAGYALRAAHSARLRRQGAWHRIPVATHRDTPFREQQA